MIQSNLNKDLERKIDLYINGKLNAEQTDELWAELIQDEYYLDYMKSVANLKAVILESREHKPSPAVFQLRKVASYAAAAAVIIFAAVIGVMNYNSSNNTMSIEPITEIGLEVIRSTEDAAADKDVIKTAIQMAANGNIQQAVTLLENELKTAEESQLVADISLSLGSILYNSGDYTAAISNFERVVNQSDIKQDVLEKGYWFLGNAYFQLDRLPEAREAFQKAYRLDGSYSRVAKSYIDALEAVK